MDKVVKITIRNNYVKIAGDLSQLISTLRYFDNHYVEMGLEPVTTIMPDGSIKRTKRPCITTRYYTQRMVGATTEVFINKQLFIHAWPYLQSTLPKTVERHDEPFYNRLSDPLAIRADIAMNPQWTLREVQQDVVKWGRDFLTEPISRQRKILLDLPTGVGKTVSAVGMCSDYKVRTLMVLQPRLCDKWEGDLKSQLAGHVTVSDTISSMVNFINYLKGSRRDDMIIVSVNIMRDYIKAWLDSESDKVFLQTHPCLPEDIMLTLRAGITLVDELHENYHFNYVLSSVVDCELFIGLSATYINGSDRLRRIMHWSLPTEYWYGKVKPKPHATVTEYRYLLESPHHFANVSHGYGYSHLKLEKLLMKRKLHGKDYVKMVISLVKRYYLQDYQSGDKCLIYGASNAMNDLLAEKLAAEFPDKSVMTYIRNEPIENVLKPDIRVTSPGKCKSAMDIPGLTTIIATVLINEVSTTLQMLGRGRPIEGRTIRYVYLVSPDINKHASYSNEKRRQFKSAAKVFEIEEHPHKIGAY